MVLPVARGLSLARALRPDVTTGGPSGEGSERSGDSSRACSRPVSCFSAGSGWRPGVASG